MRKRRKRRGYNWDLIVRDYESGLSLPQIKLKYGVSTSQASEIVRSYGKIRSISDAVALAKSGYTMGWRKMFKMPRARTRTVVVPAALLYEVGVNPDKNLIYKWSVEDKRLVLEIREEVV